MLFAFLGTGQSIKSPVVGMHPRLCGPVGEPEAQWGRLKPEILNVSKFEI